MTRIAIIAAVLCTATITAVEQVVSDFETLDGWSGLIPDTETVKEGKQAGLWADATRENSISFAGPLDWSGFKGIKLWIHSTAANGQRIDLLAFSRTEGLDYYQFPFILDWTGWRELAVPFYAFTKVRRTAGWNRIDGFSISARWGDVPRKDTVLRLDNLRLTDEVPEQYRGLLTNQELIEAIELDRPGLATVRALAEQEKWDEAAEALLAYYAAIKEVRHTVDTSNGPPAPNPNYNTGRADHALKHEFAFYRSDYHFVGETIDWTADPVKDYQWPVALNRHGDLVALARAWWYTGQDKYAAAAADFLHQWIAAAQVSNVKQNDVYWSTLNAGCRLSAWPEAWMRLLKADAFDHATRLEMLKMFHHHAEYLTRFHGAGNWLVTESQSVLGAALLLPEFKRATVWEQTAMRRLCAEVQTQTYPGGAQLELTPHYHLVCINGFVKPVRLMRRNGRDMPADYLAKLEKMYEYLMHVSKPDRHIPMLNDSDHNNIQGLMRDGAELFGRDDMLHIATDGVQGAQPEACSLAMTWAGQYVMRSDWSAGARYLLFDAGPYGIGHQHEDKLNIDLSAFGADLILDPGRFTYAAGKWRDFFLQTGGHNLILVDGGGQSRRRSPRDSYVAKRPVPVTWASHAAFDYARGTYDEGFGADAATRVAHTRAIWFAKPDYWVVADFLRPEDDAGHEYEMLWHFGDGEATVDGPTIRFAGHKAGIIVAPSLTDAQVEIIKGREDPPQGWISYWYAEKQPAPTAVCGFRADDVDIATVLMPFPGQEFPVLNTTALDVEGGVGVQVTTDRGSRAFIFAAPDSRTVTWNGYESDGEAFAVYSDLDGTVTATYFAAGSYLRGPNPAPIARTR